MKNILNDEICEKLCEAAKEKANELNIDISFAINDNRITSTHQKIR